MIKQISSFLIVRSGSLQELQFFLLYYVHNTY
jgi:hypothetical protein